MTIVLFFFQAEDGIRDGHVTGVQTCALPISKPLPAVRVTYVAGGVESVTRTAGKGFGPEDVNPKLLPGGIANAYRSEERREGKREELGGLGVDREKIEVGRGRSS